MTIDKDSPDKFFPLRYEDGPDYCTVKDARGKDFALTVQPDVLKEMEIALRVALVNSISHSRSSAGTDDPTSNPAWNDGCDFAMTQLCIFLGVNQSDVRWDAATETVDGDVQAVIGNILRAKFGENWGPEDDPISRIGVAKPLPSTVEQLDQLRAAPQSPKLPPIPIHWARPQGGTFEEMRANVWKTGLADKGDTILVWVNEGDFIHAQIVCGGFEHTSPLSRPEGA